MVRGSAGRLAYDINHAVDMAGIVSEPGELEIDHAQHDLVSSDGRMRSFMGVGEPGRDNNRTLRGGRKPNDPVFSGFDMQKLVHDRVSIDDLWSPFYALDQIL